MEVTWTRLSTWRSTLRIDRQWHAKNSGRIHFHLRINDVPSPCWQIASKRYLLKNSLIILLKLLAVNLDFQVIQADKRLIQTIQISMKHTIYTLTPHFNHKNKTKITITDLAKNNYVIRSWLEAVLFFIRVTLMTLLLSDKYHYHNGLNRRTNLRIISFYHGLKWWTYQDY